MGIAGLKLCLAGYFGDFSTLSRPELQTNTAWAVGSLFGLLGLNYAREGAKTPDVPAVFKMLGVQVDTSRAQQGEIAVSPTAKRKLDLGQALEETLSDKKLSAKMAERLRGHMVFYECFAAGRTTNLPLKTLGICAGLRGLSKTSLRMNVISSLL